MANKTTKKTVAKKATVKKTARKPAVKKTVVKKADVKPEVKVMMAAPVAAPEHKCECGENCPCHRRASKFWRVVKWLVVIAVAFCLGCYACRFCPRHHGFGPRAHFVNGCLDAASVKCPKMLEMLPAMDADQDGCITRQEYKAMKKQLHQEMAK